MKIKFYGNFCLAGVGSSLPEVGGDFVEYLEPTNVPLWVDKIKFYSQNPNVLKAKEQLIKTPYKVNLWETTAKQIVDNINSNEN